MEIYKDLYADKNRVINYLNHRSDFGEDNFAPWYCDEEVVFVAVKNYSPAFQYASEELRSNREFALKCISEDGICLKFVASNLADNKEFIIEAVKLNSDNLMFVSQEFKDDKDVVVEAVKQDEGSILYASQRLRDFVNDCGTVKAIESSILADQLQQSLLHESSARRSVKKLKL